MVEYAQFGEWGLAFQPVLDKATMPRHPLAALADADIDLMIGWTTDEASFAFGMNPQYAEVTREQVVGWATKRYGDDATGLYDAYTAASAAASPRQVLTQLVTDGLFRCGALQVADARAITRPVHAYQFEVTSPVLEGVLGAPHCMELAFTFANITRWGSAPLFSGLQPEVIRRVTDALHNAWIGFIRDGQPCRDGVPSWRPYMADDRAILVIGAESIRTETNLPRPGLCASP
jgi:carboxylesterase type B